MEKVHPSVFLTSFDQVYYYFETCGEDFSWDLYQYCEYHQRRNALLEWAARNEVEESLLGDVFRGNTITMKLLLFQFFDDAGKAYLTKMLVPLIQRLLSEKNLEVEEEKVGRSKADKNVKLLLKLVTSFLRNLVQSADSCPSSLRETFALMKETAKAKFGSVGEDIMSGVVFSRFICPVLVDPMKYQIYANGKDKVLQGKEQRGLVIASKIIQSIANKHAFNARGLSEQNAAKIEQFIHEQYPMIEEYINLLTGVKDRATIRRESFASIASLEAREIEERLYASMNNLPLKTDFELQQQLDNIKNTLNSNMEGWRAVASSKKRGITTYIRKFENNPGVFSCTKTRLSVDIHTAYEHIKDLRKSFSTMKIIETVRHVEKIDENHHEWVFTFEPRFPFNGRDFVVCTKTIYPTPNSIMMLMYSVTRDDCLQTPNYVRGIMKDSCYLLETDPNNAQGCNLSFLFAIDVKINTPAWLVAHGGTAIMKYVKGLQDVLRKGKNASFDFASKLDIQAELTNNQ